MTKKNNNRSEYWRFLTDELKKYGNLKSAIKDQIEKRDKIQKEVNDLNKQKRDFKLLPNSGFFNKYNK